MFHARSAARCCAGWWFHQVHQERMRLHSDGDSRFAVAHGNGECGGAATLPFPGYDRAGWLCRAGSAERGPYPGARLLEGPDGCSQSAPGHAVIITTYKNSDNFARAALDNLLEVAHLRFIMVQTARDGWTTWCSASLSQSLAPNTTWRPPALKDSRTSRASWPDRHCKVVRPPYVASVRHHSAPPGSRVDRRDSAGARANGPQRQRRHRAQMPAHSIQRCGALVGSRIFVQSSEGTAQAEFEVAAAAWNCIGTRPIPSSTEVGELNMLERTSEQCPEVVCVAEGFFALQAAGGRSKDLQNSGGATRARAWVVQVEGRTSRQDEVQSMGPPQAGGPRLRSRARWVGIVQVQLRVWRLASAGRGEEGGPRTGGGWCAMSGIGAV